MKRISEKAENLLNRQILKEAQASQLYLCFGVWAERRGFTGVADLLFRHSLEERDHMMKVLRYVIDRQGDPEIGTLDAPMVSISDLHDCLVQLYEHEVANTNAINEIATNAMEERDWPTWNFAQWFVREQTEEENLILNMMDQLKIADPNNLLVLDRIIGQSSGDATLAQDVTSEDPSGA